MDIKDLYVPIECPYNKSHLITPLKMPYHLHKCRKNNPDMVMAVCPYNANHEIRTAELKFHMAHCPNRTLLERDFAHNALQNALIGKEEVAVKGNTELPRPVRTESHPQEDLENWDDDVSPHILTRPQSSGRTQSHRRRKSDRQEIESQLRRPQTKSIAESFTPLRSFTKDGNDNTPTQNNQTGRQPNDPGMRTAGRPGVLKTASAKTRDNSSKSSSSNDDDGQEVRNVTESMARLHPPQENCGNDDNVRDQPLVLNSRLLQQTSNFRRPVHDSNYLFAVGRGRARPALHQPPKESPRLLEQAGFTTPNYVRLGRGGFKPLVYN